VFRGSYAETLSVFDGEGKEVRVAVFLVAAAVPRAVPVATVGTLLVGVKVTGGVPTP
jgi:hypothetical protein